MAFFEWIDRRSPAADLMMLILALLAMAVFIRLSRGER
jgi:hypothetical protein